jgi:hypothetical protein
VSLFGLSLDAGGKITVSKNVSTVALTAQTPATRVGPNGDNIRHDDVFVALTLSKQEAWKLAEALLEASDG